MGCLLKYFLASRHLFLGEKGYYVRALFPYGSSINKLRVLCSNLSSEWGPKFPGCGYQ